MPDIMSRKARSRVMSRIRGTNTGPERIVAAMLRRRGLRFGKHPRRLPGRPDVYFSSAKVAVFVDGDFWHGWRFPEWARKLTPFWRRKIGLNRARDRRNHARLRRMGWKVVRLWEHEIERAPANGIDRVVSAVACRG